MHITTAVYRSIIRTVATPQTIPHSCSDVTQQYYTQCSITAAHQNIISASQHQQRSQPPQPNQSPHDRKHRLWPSNVKHTSKAETTATAQPHYSANTAYC
jgi:hypothetical protein